MLSRCYWGIPKPDGICNSSNELCGLLPVGLVPNTPAGRGEASWSDAGSPQLAVFNLNGLFPDVWASASTSLSKLYQSARWSHAPSLSLLEHKTPRYSRVPWPWTLLTLCGGHHQKQNYIISKLIEFYSRPLYLWFWKVSYFTSWCLLSPERRWSLHLIHLVTYNELQSMKKVFEWRELSLPLSLSALRCIFRLV